MTSINNLSRESSTLTLEVTFDKIRYGYVANSAIHLDKRFQISRSVAKASFEPEPLPARIFL